MKFAHIINPVNVSPTSDLYIAQPITFETMRRARDYAKGTVEIELYTTQYPEDHEVLPEGFTVLPDLERSVLDVGNFQHPRKLPLLKDILDRLYEATDADYMIYTNVDIALMPYFYVSVAKMLEAHDALVINRRNIPAHYTRVDQIPSMIAEVGAITAGFDCFVFPRTIYSQFILGHVALGIARVDFPLYTSMLVFADSFKEYGEAHLTFHIGREMAWREEKYTDYDRHNQQELLQILVKLRERVGAVDHTTKLGQFLLEVYQRRKVIDYARDFLLQDNDQLPAKVLANVPAKVHERKTRKLIIIYLKRMIKPFVRIAVRRTDKGGQGV